MTNSFRKTTLFTLTLLSALCTACTKADGSVNNNIIASADSVTNDSIESDDVALESKYPTGVEKLMTVYPDYVTGFEDNHLILKDGSRIVWDDGREKSFDGLLDDTDPEDMFFSPYPALGEKPEYLADPGRGRSEALFKAMYGKNASDVQRHLVRVDWFGQRVLFSSRNGAADSLRAVARELAVHPDMRKYLTSAGTFYWRKVRGSQRQSAHSYGIAIDIGGNNTDYWKWRNPRAKETDHIDYRNRMPLKIAEIFRRHGFIWGGDWYHYDTMHFEFRPELLH